MSLRRRLLLILGGTFALLWSCAALWLLGDLRHELDRMLDQRLESSAHMVAGLLEQIPRPATSAYMSPFEHPLLGGLKPGLVCQVRTLRGEVLVRTPYMQFEQSDAELLGFSHSLVDGQEWRTYTVQRNQLLITIGDQLDERWHLQRVILLAAGLPVVLALLGSLLLIWFGTVRGLSPLDRLRLQLTKRAADDLSPVSPSSAPAELRPLIGTLNQLFAQLSALLERERRFNDDAAHELRTPLTAIKTHLQVAAMAQPDQAALSLERAGVAVERMQATLEQLLLLARLDSGEESQAPQQVEVLDAVRQVMENLFVHPGFERIEVDSRLTGCCQLQMPDRLLAMAIRNLLENALKYAAEGPVLLRVQRDDSAVLIEVVDQGDGLSAEDFVAAQKRFWRAQASANGSGLGLSIVSAICQRYRGELGCARRGEGFVVWLRFEFLA